LIKFYKPTHKRQQGNDLTYTYVDIWIGASRPPPHLDFYRYIGYKNPPCSVKNIKIISEWSEAWVVESVYFFGAHTEKRGIARAALLGSN
jgi:hypothetical protein